MSNAKHTPGPWNLGNSDIPVSAVSVNGGNRKHTTLARIASPEFVGMSLQEGLANARLIAAAPDMADLIEELVSCFLSRDESGAFQSFNLDAEFCSKAFSVIAKARGE